MDYINPTGTVVLIIIIFHSGDHLQQQHAAIARSSDAGRGIAAAMTQSAWPLNTVFASTWRSVRMLTIVSLLFLTSGTDPRCHGTLDCLTVSLSPPGVPSPATHFFAGLWFHHFFAPLCDFATAGFR